MARYETQRVAEAFLAFLLAKHPELVMTPEERLASVKEFIPGFERDQDDIQRRAQRVLDAQTPDWKKYPSSLERRWSDGSV